MSEKFQKFVWSLVCLLWLPIVFFNFLQIDDHTHILNNLNLRDLAGLKALWERPFFSLYVPIVYSFWWGVYNSFGPSPIAFHLLNVVFHILNGYLLWKMLQRRNSQMALFLTLLFLIHPLQASSVAWISEFRGVLGATFALLSLNVLDSPSRRSWHFSFLFYVASVLCKPSYVVLPLLVLVLFWSRLKTNKLLASLYMFSAFLFVFAVSKITILTQQSQFAVNLSFSEKSALIFNNISFYLKKILIPYPLSLDYGLTREVMTQIEAGMWISVLVSMFVLFKVFPLYRKFFVLSLLCLLVVVLPVLGFVPFEYQYYNTVADRYLYFLFVPVGLLWAQSGARLSWLHICLLFLCSVGLLINASNYKNSENLGQQMISVNPSSFVGYTVLGQEYILLKKYSQAEESLNKAIQIKPDYWTAHSHMGELLEEQKRWKESYDYFQAIIKNTNQQYTSIPAEFLGEFMIRAGLAAHNLGLSQEAGDLFNMGRALNPRRFLELMSPSSSP